MSINEIGSLAGILALFLVIILERDKLLSIFIGIQKRSGKDLGVFFFAAAVGFTALLLITIVAILPVLILTAGYSDLAELDFRYTNGPSLLSAYFAFFFTFGLLLGAYLYSSLKKRFDKLYKGKQHTRKGEDKEHS